MFETKIEKKRNFKKYTGFTYQKGEGFTLIELLVVIAIIGLLSSIVFASLDGARKKSRDAKRLADMEQVQLALEFYYDEHGRYPSSDADGCGSWDIGNATHDFISGGLGDAMPDPPEDLSFRGNCDGYRYYRYPAGYGECPIENGAFYILGVVNLESISGAHPSSPGFGCPPPTQNWYPQFEWFTGKYEKS